jgi:hypothetical protein
MAQQRASYPLDYSKGPTAKPAADRVADTTTDQFNRVADGAEELAGNVAQPIRAKSSGSGPELQALREEIDEGTTNVDTGRGGHGRFRSGRIVEAIVKRKHGTYSASALPYTSGQIGTTGVP